MQEDNQYVSRQLDTEKKDKRQRLCKNLLERNHCPYQNAPKPCWHAHPAKKNLKKFKFDSYLFYLFKTKLEKIDKLLFWIVETSNPASSILTYAKSEENDMEQAVEEAFNQVVGTNDMAYEAAIRRYVTKIRQDTRCGAYGLELSENPYVIRERYNNNPQHTVKSITSPEALKFWTVKKGSSDIHPLNKTDPRPTLRGDIKLGDTVEVIPKINNPKPVSALDVSCGTKEFAAHILAVEKVYAPDIVCSGSTLSQILNWLMELRYNWDRHLICFEKMGTSVWAHCLYADPDQVPTTQSEDIMAFTTSIEEFLLTNVQKDEFIYATSPFNFGDFKLLTYYEVDGFLGDQPLEIKSQKIVPDFLGRNSAESIKNSYIFTPGKNCFRYLQYSKKTLNKDGSAYKIENGKISDSLSENGKSDNNNAQRPMNELHGLLTRVKSMLKEEDCRAVVLQLQPHDAKIEFRKIKKNGGIIKKEEEKENQIKSKKVTKTHKKEAKTNKNTSCANTFALLAGEEDAEDEDDSLSA